MNKTKINKLEKELKTDQVFQKQINEELHNPDDFYEVVGRSHILGRCCGKPGVKLALYFKNISPKGKITTRRYNYHRYYCQECGGIIDYGRLNVGIAG